MGYTPPHFHSLAMHRIMKKVLAVVACGGCLVAPSQAYSSGWGAAGSAAGGAGGAWPTVPPTKLPGAPDQEQDGIFPPDDPNGRRSAPDGNGNYYNENRAAGGAGTGQDGTAGLQRESAAAGGNAGFNEPPNYYQQQQQQQQQRRQEQSYEQPPYDPQRSHWAGQQYSPPPHQRQHEHAPVYDHDRFPQNNGLPPPSPDGGQRLGTKLKSIVSRVKDVVRPGQPIDYGQPGYYQGNQGGGGGGWGNGGGGGGGYPPPDSNWVRGTNQNAEYAPPAGTYGQAQPDAYAGYGYEEQQQGPPPAAAYDPVSEQQEPPPAAGFDPHRAQQGRYPPEEDRAASNHVAREYHAALPPAFPDPRGSAPTGAWPPPQPLAADVLQASGSYGGGGGGPGMPGAATSDHGREATEGDLTPPQGGGVAPPREPPRGPPYEPSQTAVGQGWAASDTHPRGSEGGGNAPGESPFQQPSNSEAFLQQGPRAVIREGAQDRSGAVGPSASMPAAPPDEQDATARGQGGEQLPAAGAPWDPPAWMPPGEQSRQGNGLGGAVASDPPGHVDSGPGQHTGTPETHVEPNQSISGVNRAARPAASGGNRSGSYRASGGGVELDTMPSSADHGMEKVDWGEAAEEDEEGQRRQEDESGETVIIAGGEESLEQEREEEALIRELERMESMNGGEVLDGGEIRNDSSATPTIAQTVPPCECEDEALLDEAVEHRLNDLFDSILDDDLDIAAEGAECIVTQPEDSLPPFASPATATLSAYPPGMETDTESRDAAPREGWGVEGGGASGAEQSQPWGVQAASDLNAGVGSPKAGEPHTQGDEGGLRATDGAAPAWVGDAVGSNEEGTMMWRESTATGSADEETAGSMWGKTDRWASLPSHAIVVSESEEGEEEEGGWGGGERAGDEEEESDFGVPLDPIELPPSAATDEIWNDQHLQDQLDAYWEQSRRRGGLAGGGHGLPTASSEVRKLSTYGGHLQPTYGPGDWVGKGTAMVQEPLPGAVDGVGRSSWATPHLFQGSQSPINIYGNVHVHLQPPGKDGEKQAAPSTELSARERYFSQGETSWSGSERGGQ